VNGVADVGFRKLTRHPPDICSPKPDKCFFRSGLLKILTILKTQPSGGKVARAAAVSPLIEAGNVYLPHPHYTPRVNDFIEECADFPNGAHDDQGTR